MVIDTIIGTEKKLLVSIPQTPEYDIANDSHTFDVELFCNGSKVFKVPKEQIKSDDTDQYARIVTFNTADIGCGRLKCRIIAYIPDADFNSTNNNTAFRTEIYDFITEINIINGLK